MCIWNYDGNSVTEMTAREEIKNPRGLGECPWENG